VLVVGEELRTEEPGMVADDVFEAELGDNAVNPAPGPRLVSDVDDRREVDEVD